MKKICLLITLLITMNIAASNETQEQDTNISVSVAPKEHAKCNLFFGVVGKPSKELRSMVEIIKKDLEFSGQFNVTLVQIETVHTKQEIEGLSAKGYGLAIFINDAEKYCGTNQKMRSKDCMGSPPEVGSLEWRVYDTAQVAMLKGAKYSKRGSVLRGWAHNISDALWSTLAGQDGFFSTKIAYCKDVHRPKKKKIKHIYVADYDGSNEQEIINLPTVNVAPRWNNDSKTPMLFYSEYTNSNVRLVAVKMDKKRKLASNFDGVNMLPAFSADGKQVAYCASHGDGNCQLYYYEPNCLGHSTFRKLTHNQGNNVSPNFSADGKSLFFCSDYQTGKPQIYRYDFANDAIERLTHDGYCASPSYCPSQNKLAYSKMIHGTMQLFAYDVETQEHTQLTFDRGNKEECSWSPCGNFLLFSYELGIKSRIALLNVVTNKRQFLTSEKQVCSYPCWSPAYDEFPVVS